jgi:hypothetical protein
VSGQYQTFFCRRLVTIARLLNRSQAHLVREWAQVQSSSETRGMRSSSRKSERFCTALRERMSDSRLSADSGPNR